MGVDCADFVGEGGGVGDVWVAGFDPEEVGEGGVFDGSFGGGGLTGAVVVESFAGTGDVDVEVDGFVC